MAFRDGVPVASCLMEAAAWRRTVKVGCRCGHAAFFDPHALWWFYERRGWDGTFAVMRRRYFCSACLGATGRRVRPVVSAEGHEQPTVKLPWPPESEWKRAVNRFR